MLPGPTHQVSILCPVQRDCALSDLRIPSRSATDLPVVSPESALGAALEGRSVGDKVTYEVFAVQS